MVTLGKKYGRLANRLWIFAYFAANAIEHKYLLVYRNFDEYNKYFEATFRNDFKGHLIKSRLSRNPVIDTIRYYVNYLWIKFISKYREKGKNYEILRIRDQEEAYDLNQSTFLEKAKNTHLVVMQGGYWYVDNKNLEKHRQLIGKFFEPRQKFRKNIDALIDRTRGMGDCLVGVHLRKTDFSRACKGKYFYEDSTYKRKMLEVEGELKNRGKKPVFLICSDEKVIEENFREVNYIIGNGHLIEDLYSFAKCDFLIGPPSTYTAWASFYGNVPVKYLAGDLTPAISMLDFKVVENISQIFDLLRCDAR